jgi:hypothetical protein
MSSYLAAVGAGPRLALKPLPILAGRYLGTGTSERSLIGLLDLNCASQYNGRPHYRL